MSISTIDLTPIEGLLKQVKREYVDAGLRYGWKSNQRKEYDHGHWNRLILPDNRAIGYDHNELQYLEENPLIAELWSNIQETLGDRVLVRAYVNGYTYGTDAYFHKDDTWLVEEFGEDIVSETVLIYLNDEWDRDWGGETSFVDDDDNILASVFPKKNRCVVFDSNLWHRAGSLSRYCPVLRSIIVFKTAGPQYNRPWVKWIKDRTENIHHPGTTMFRHLYNTAMTIASKSGISADVIKAGLYHSVYDTEYFKAGLDVTRGEVKEQIGEVAENLAYLFCSTPDRYNAFMNNTGNWDAETQFALLVMELANTLEQAPRLEYSVYRNERISRLDAKISSFELEYKS